jgi:hypothetical protein
MRITTLILTFTLAILASSACASSSSQDVSIEYRRTGGFAGFDDHLVIYTDGSAVLTRQDQQSEFSIAPESMQQLQDLFSQADFGDLRREYLPERQTADVFEYVISYQGKSVRTKDTAIPSELVPLIQALNEIVDSGRGSLS